MAADKKAIAAMIVGNAKKPEETNPYPDDLMEDEAEADESGLDVAVDDLMAGFDAKDPSMVKAALRSFFEQM